jgi:hypothetical protein
VAGKLGGQGIISAVRPSRLFYVTDSASSRRFLVDTGSAFSIMPWQSKSTPSGPSLAGGADGRQIPCWGEKSFTVSLDGVQRSWDFLLAVVSFPILGADFLRHHSLLVEVANLRLLPGPISDRLGGRSSRACQHFLSPLVCRRSALDAAARPALLLTLRALSSSFGLSVAVPGLRPRSPSPPSSDWSGELQAWFPAAFGRTMSAPAATPPHGVRHAIRTVGQPTTAKFRRLDPARLAAAKASFRRCWMRACFAVPAASGVALHTWIGKKTARGGPAATTAS